MDRLTGSYKRFTQLITFLVGLALAAAFNVDAVAVGQRLYAEPTLRAHMVAAAQLEAKGAAPAKPGADLSASFPAYSKAESDLEKTSLVGWSPGKGAYAFDWLVLLGCLMTALAGLLGAPFWFDTLKSVVNVRNAGPKPDSTTSS